jgi:glycylpeptide N-tetradecanoyltransferase
MTESTVQDNDQTISEVEDDELDNESLEDTSPAAASSSKKKKKKKKSKAIKALNAITGKSSDIPKALVDHVMDQVKADGAVGSDQVTEEVVKQTLEQLKIMDVIKGKAGLGGINKKDVGEHKVVFLVPLS